MTTESIPKKATLGAIAVAALSVGDKSLTVAVCITIISVIGIAVQGVIDYKKKGSNDPEENRT